MSEEIQFEESSGNVFKDLGLLKGSRSKAGKRIAMIPVESVRRLSC